MDRLLDGAYSPGEHRSAVQRESRAAEQQRHCRRQLLDLLTHASPVRLDARTRKRRNRPPRSAGEGSAPGQRFCVRRSLRPVAGCLVRQYGPRIGAWPRLLHLGRLCQLRQLSAGAEGNRLYFSQAVIWVKEHPVLTRKDFMGNHEWCFYGWRRAPHTSGSGRTTPPTCGASRR